MVIEIDAELEQQVACRIHLVDPAGRVLSTAHQETVEQQLADDVADLAPQPISVPCAPRSVEALDRGRGQPLHEDRSQELHLRGVGAIRDDLHGHAERSQGGRECFGPLGRRREQAMPSPFSGTGPSSATSANRSGDRGQLVLQRGRRGVEIGVDRPIAECEQRRLGSRRPHSRRWRSARRRRPRPPLAPLSSRRRGQDQGRSHERRSRPRQVFHGEPQPRPVQHRNPRHVSLHSPVEVKQDC